MRSSIRVAWMLGAFVLPGCENDTLDHPIVFVVPDGYEGPVLIVGGETSPQSECTDEGYLMQITSDGMIRLTDDEYSLFSKWHELSLRTESGEMRETELHGGISNERNILYYVGTKAAADDFLYTNYSAQIAWFEERGVQWHD